MAYMLVKHKVEDYDKWKAGFDAAAEFRKSNGEKSAVVFRNTNNPGELSVLCEWESLEKAREFIALPELKEKMKEAGITEEPDIKFLDEA